MNIKAAIVLSTLLAPWAYAQQPPGKVDIPEELVALRQQLNATNLPATQAKLICDQLIPKVQAMLPKSLAWRMVAEQRCLKIELKVGDRRAAMEALEEMLRYSEQLPPVERGVAQLLGHEALIAPNKEDARLDVALAHGNAALKAIYDYNGKPSDFAQAVLVRLCQINEELKQLETAEQQCQLVLRMRADKPVTDSVKVDAQLSHFVIAIQKPGTNLDRTAIQLRELIASFEAAGFYDTRIDSIMYARGLLANTYRAAKKYAEAEQVLLEGIAYLDKNPRSKTMALELRSALHSHYLETYRPAEAKQVLDAINALQDEASQRDGDLVTRINAAISLLWQKNYDDAISEFEGLAQILERRRAALNMSPGAKATYFERYRVVSNNLVSAYSRRGNAEAALLVLEESKARAATEHMRTALVLKALDGAEEKAAAELLKKISAASTALALASPLSLTAAEAEKQRFAAQAGLDKLVDMKVAASPDVLGTTSQLDLKQMVQKFRDGHVYLSWQVSKAGETSVLVVRDGQVIVPNPVARNLVRLQSTVDAFRQYLMRGEAALAAAGLKFYRSKDVEYALATSKPDGFDIQVTGAEVQASLSATLLDSITPHLKGAKRITISPDGPLWLVPFEALQLGGSYLVQGADISYVPSLSWAISQERRAAKHKAGMSDLDLLALGNPVFRKVMDPGVPLGAYDLALLRDANLKSAASFMSVLSRLLNAAPDLPGTQVEVEAIARLFAQERTRQFLGAQAIESSLHALNASGDLAKYRRLHFATHGVVNTSNPMLSALLLGRTGARTSEDGYLTALEIAGWSLNAELVVLSACDSAVGKILGGDGVLGLPYAFSIAGAQTTVQTLWPIPDLWTAVFMETFYKGLESGQTPVSALSAAKRHALQGSAPMRQKGVPVPWAAFVSYGF